jgi:glyoxylase-like metal-dependent hydrolase (beta-lactamase superfamily II)
MEVPGRTMVMNLSLIVDPVNGPVLVDAGMPGTEAAIDEALASEGFSAAGLKHIIITHQDVDHIGSLAAIKEMSKAAVVAHSVEAPYIDGRTRLLKYPSQQTLDENPRSREIFGGLRYEKVDRLVEDGDVLDLAGGVRVIHTPGHAPGHMCLYLERTKTLIAGDALTSTEGHLNGPNPGATPDMVAAIASVEKLAALDEVSAIVCYHGGLVTEDALGQLRRVAGELTAGIAG